VATGEQVVSCLCVSTHAVHTCHVCRVTRQGRTLLLVSGTGTTQIVGPKHVSLTECD
jgi:hypothetical protein